MLTGIVVKEKWQDAIGKWNLDTGCVDSEIRMIVRKKDFREYGQPQDVGEDTR